MLPRPNILGTPAKSDGDDAAPAPDARLLPNDHILPAAPATVPLRDSRAQHWRLDVATRAVLEHGASDRYSIYPGCASLTPQRRATLVHGRKNDSRIIGPPRPDTPCKC
ncbi:hypothetical protein ACN47E_008821 [Coniothyrium glycines]